MDLAAGIAILLLACVGNAELWVILANRYHSLPYPHRVLRRMRFFHDVGILCFPVLILLIAGVGNNGLLNGGKVQDLPFPTQLVLIAALTGMIPFILGVVRWRREQRRLPGTQSHQEIHDFSSSTDSEDDRQAILGHQTFMARLPFNEIYQLEVNHKQLKAGSNGRSSGTVRIAHFSDMHLLTCPGDGFHQRVADELCRLEPDFYAFTGDLIDSDHQAELAVRLFEQIRDVAPGYFILGNHDWHLDYESLRKRVIGTGWIDVAQKHISADVHGLNLMIAGTEAPWIGTNPGIPAPNGEAMRLLLSHSPDQRNYACRNQFDLMLCGHNHGGQVVLPFVGPVYSPSRYGVKYAGGMHRHRNLAFHVSRGTGAKDTLRWNCRPEITLLEVDV